jgi:hypothetical protein
MKLKFILLIGFLWSGWALRGQTAFPQTFDLNDQNGLLCTLFDSRLLDANGDVLWKPLTFADAVRANLSDDGYFHTALDTALFYSAFGIRRAVAVFATYHYEKGEVSDCAACGVQLSVAIFDEAPDGLWHLERFAKHFNTLGGVGENGTVGLLQLGENQWCLTLEMGWVGQGVYGEYVSILNLEDLEKVFYYVIHEDNAGALGEDSDRTYSFEKTLHPLRGVETPTGWWEFDLVTRGTEPDEDVERAVPANAVQRYVFDWETGTYMKFCQ